MDAYTCRYVDSVFENGVPMLRRISELPGVTSGGRESYTLADGQIRCGGQSASRGGRVTPAAPSPGETLFASRGKEPYSKSTGLLTPRPPRLSTWV
jgi:hypothetical protein